ncbi:hypothetical protein D3C81_2140670 [compost metagenome]
MGDGFDGLVQLLVGDANAGAVADLQLQVLDDQALQHLLAEHMLGRQRGAALGAGLLHFVQALVQLALHDHVVIDDGDHSVDGANLGMREAAEEQGAQQ